MCLTQMMLSNHVSRFHVAAAAIDGAILHNPHHKVSVDAYHHKRVLMHEVEGHKKYALDHAKDMDHVYDIKEFKQKVQ